MADGRRWRVTLYWMLIATLGASGTGCFDHSGATAGTAADETVVALVDGTPITAHELDESLRSELDQLERARYELRLGQLRRLIAARVLGTERAEQDLDQAFRAASARADVEIRLAPPAASSANTTAVVASAQSNDGTSTTATDTTRRSDLPVTLMGTVVRDEPGKSMAAVRLRGALLARNVEPGQSIVDGAVLVRVERNRIIVRRNGELEFVPLSVISEPNTPTPARTVARLVRTPDTVLTLRRSDVDRALRDVPALERSLIRAAPELDGRRLLVVASVDPGSLYDLLQLQDRDVLMQVNSEWVDERRNPLWDALRTDESVTLMIMRAGQPRSFAYVIN